MDDPSDDLPNLQARVTQYATARGLELKHSLGFGKDGSVFSTQVATAIKGYSSRIPYHRERDCYVRLYETGVTEVLGHQVPEILGFDDDLCVLEMTMVRPPYILDFASAHLDYAPDFSPEVLEKWEHDRLEEFGSHWPRVFMIIEFMKDQYGIFLTDVHPRNITFAEA